MTDSGIGDEGILESCKPDLLGIRQIIRNLKSLAFVEYAYDQLNHTNDDSSKDGLLENEMITTSLVISYGRIFASSEGVTQLNAKILPPDLKNTHFEIIDLRNKVYAHHLNHNSINSQVIIYECSDFVEVEFEVQQEYFKSAPQHWRPLFVWLNSYLNEIVEKKLEKLSKKTGKKWIRKRFLEVSSDKNLENLLCQIARNWQ